MCSSIVSPEGGADFVCGASLASQSSSSLRSVLADSVLADFTADGTTPTVSAMRRRSEASRRSFASSSPPIRSEQENNSGAVLEALALLDRAAGEGLAVVIITHQRKSEGKHGEDLGNEAVVKASRERATVIDAQLLERDFAGDAYADRDLVFADELGDPVHPQRLTEWFRRHRKAAGIPAGTLHVLRHTAATLALTSGVPVHIVAARLGDTPATVLGTYAHLLPQSDEIAAESVAELLAR
jgi:hypothetical protein